MELEDWSAEELKALEDRIVSQCEQRQAEGWEIISDDFGNVSQKYCCALGTFPGVIEAWDDARTQDWDAVAEALDLGLSAKATESFVDGFDGNAIVEAEDAAAYYLGQRVRARVLVDE